MGEAGAVRVTQVAAGKNHSLAVDEFQRIWGWGCADGGQIGMLGEINRQMLGEIADQSEPKHLHPWDVGLSVPRGEPYVQGEAIVQLDAGYYHSLALTRSGKLYMIGHGCPRPMVVEEHITGAYSTAVLVEAEEVRDWPAHPTEICAGARNTIIADDSSPRRNILAWGMASSGQCGFQLVWDGDTPEIRRNLQLEPRRVHLPL